LVASLAAFAAWGQITRKVRVPGHLLPQGGIVQLVAPAADIAARVAAAAGDAASRADRVQDRHRSYWRQHGSA
jgi:hypothetical protein